MMLICGTIPQEDFPLSIGTVKFSGKSLTVGAREILCLQGTAALIGAACVTTEYLGEEPPHALLVGDRGTGKGSRLLYEYLSKNLPPPCTPCPGTPLHPSRHGFDEEGM